MDALLAIKELQTHRGEFFLGPVTMEIPRGTIVGLIGENGAGKSTLIKSALGLCWRRGEVRILPDNPPDRDWRQDVGVVMDNPGMPDYIYPYQVEEIMSQVYENWDKEYFLQLLNRLDLPDNRKFSDLSSGGKKKMELAIAMSHAPKLLILDEPAAGLDPVARDQLCDMLMDYTREEDRAVLISSHILSDLERICDYIAFLHNGELVFFEEKDRLLEKFGIYRCSKEERMALPRAAIRGFRSGPYGEEVLICKNQLPQLQTGITTIEDIMVLMVKGAKP